MNTYPELLHVYSSFYRQSATSGAKAPSSMKSQCQEIHRVATLYQVEIRLTAYEISDNQSTNSLLCKASMESSGRPSSLGVEIKTSDCVHFVSSRNPFISSNQLNKSLYIMHAHTHTEYILYPVIEM